MTCSVCGRPLPDGARFCPNCGASVGPLVHTEERKMVTVLFADIVDSTGLGGRLDAERSREVLGQFFGAASEELLALRGRPEKFIGDAVMAVFGMPAVHEDDALRAVRAGLAIRGRTRRLGEAAGLAAPLEVRIGIESGEAAMGRNPSGQMLVTGPVVNEAARLQSAARPGELLAGSTTHALTATTVSYGRRRHVRAKGFDAGLDAFPVDGLTTRSARRTIPFVGRASEQAILDQSLGLTTSTGRPVLVTVLGEPGIGKSRLADELAAGVGAAVVVLRGQPRSYTDTATFSPAAAIIGDLAGIDAGDPPDKIKSRLRELADRCCDPSEADLIAQRLALLFGLAERPEEAAFVHDVQAGFVAIIDGLARDHPVMMLFEDAHNLKPAMLDLVERLATPGRRGPRRALIVALARNELLEERPDWGSTSGNSVLLRLDRLSPSESINLVRQSGGGRIPEQQAYEIAERAGGNPFFIIETTGMLMPNDDGTGPAVRATIPPTVQAVVSARLDALPARLRELARRASVFMYAFDLAELDVIDGAADVKELQLLEDAEVIVRQPPSSWRMRHATLKEVAYASLPKRERLRLHQLVAEYLMDAGHRSLAADRLARPRPQRPGRSRSRGRRAACRRRPCPKAHGDPLGHRPLRPRPRHGRRGEKVGHPRGQDPGGHGRGALLARRISIGHGGIEPSSDPGGRAPGSLCAVARAAIPGRHRDQLRGRRRQSGRAARSLSQRRRAARRTVGDRAHAAFRWLGALDARAIRRCRSHLAASSRHRRSQGPLGTGAGPDVAFGQPQPDERPRRSAQAHRRGRRARRAGLRPVHDRQ